AAERGTSTLCSPERGHSVRCRTYGRPHLHYKQRATMSSHTPKHNHLLAALPGADFARLLADLEPAPLEPGRALYESGGKQGRVYFPTTSIISLLYVMQDG